jgi:hypothetical protein
MSHNRPPQRSLLHSLAFVYLYIAHHGDEVGVTPEEKVAMRAKLLEWAGPGPVADSDAVDDALLDTWAYFRTLSDVEGRAELDTHLGVLRESLTDPLQRKAVIYDMAAVARSDGRVTEGERELVDIVKRVLLSD